jgi:uncharacterized LabA/DUF88 family protein
MTSLLRVAIFVDGSNLYGSLRAMNLEVSDYGDFYGHIHDEAVSRWQKVTRRPASASGAQLTRVYWYSVGSIDDWDLSLSQSQSALQKAFLKERDVHDGWLARVGKAEGLKGAALEEKAWASCFADMKVWYEKKCATLENMRRFQQAIRMATDLIDVVPAGHWKVDFLHKRVEEKGLDTSLAVDLLALEDNYDLAVVISGDADSIPSIVRMKERGKQVAAVEFVSGSPSEERGRSFSSRLKLHADFVLRVYESELLRHKHAKRFAQHA